MKRIVGGILIIAALNVLLIFFVLAQDKDLLVGGWYIKKSTIGDKVNKERNVWIFNENGTMLITNNSGRKKWVLHIDTIQITLSDLKIKEYKIVKISKNKLIIESIDLTLAETHFFKRKKGVGF